MVKVNRVCIYLVSKSANLGVWNIQNGCIVGGRCDGNLGIGPAELEQTFAVWGHRLIGNSHVIVVTWGRRGGGGGRGEGEGGGRGRSNYESIR